MTLPRRLGTLLVLAASLFAGWATPAAAHAGGLVATDASSRVVSLSPAVPGLSLTTIENGARLHLVNATGSPVSVPSGGGLTTLATVAPGHTLTWADTRASPVGVTAPSSWSLVLGAGGTPVTVSGEFTVHRAPPFAAWWALTLATAAAVPLLCRRSRRPAPILAATGLLAAAASLAHVVGSTLAVTSAPFLGTFADAAGINLLAWPLILGGARTALRGRPAGLLAVCAGAALTTVFVLPDVTAFHRAVLPFAGPALLERILVVAALGAGAGAAVAGGAVLRGLAASQRTPAEDPARAVARPARVPRRPGA